jgi:hypothetical protein
MLFLMEMRRSASHASNLRLRLGFKNVVGVDSVGHNGGLVLFWHENLEVVILGLSSQFIDTRVKDVISDLWYRISFFYGEPRAENWHHMWEML